MSDIEPNSREGEVVSLYFYLLFSLIFQYASTFLLHMLLISSVGSLKFVFRNGVCGKIVIELIWGSCQGFIQKVSQFLNEFTCLNSRISNKAVPKKPVHYLVFWIVF